MINNNATTGPLIRAYSNNASFSGNGLIQGWHDNASATGNVAHFINDGTGNAVFIDQNGSGIGLYVDNAGSNITAKLQGTGAGGIAQLQLTEDGEPKVNHSLSGTAYTINVASGGSESTSLILKTADAGNEKTALSINSTQDVSIPNGNLSVSGSISVTDAATTRTNIGLATISQAEAEAGTSTTTRAWTAQRVAQAIAAASSGGGETMAYLGTLTPSAASSIAVTSSYITSDHDHYLLIGRTVSSADNQTFMTWSGASSSYYNFWTRDYYSTYPSTSRYNGGGVGYFTWADNSIYLPGWMHWEMMVYEPLSSSTTTAFKCLATQSYAASIAHGIYNAGASVTQFNLYTNYATMSGRIDIIGVKAHT